MKTNNEIHNIEIEKKQLIDQTKTNVEKSKILELVLDDVFENDNSSSVLSDKKVLDKYINLKNKKLTEKEYEKLFVKIKYKSGFINSFSYKSADKLNVVHTRRHDDIKRDISVIEKFINDQEKNIKTIHKDLNISFSSKAQKDIHNLAKSNIRETYAQIDDLLELTQDVIFNIEVDWYYNKIYNILSLDWFIKSPSFHNPNVINKIVVDETTNISENEIKYVESNLFADFEVKENIHSFIETLKFFISNSEPIILEKEVIDQILEKYILYITESIGNVNTSITSNLESLFSLVGNDKSLLSQVKKMHHKMIAYYNKKITQYLTKYSVEVINKKFFSQSEELLSFSKELINLNKNIETILNQSKEFNINSLNDDLKTEIELVKFENNDFNEEQILSEKTRIYFLEKIDRDINEYRTIASLIEIILFYSKYIHTKNLNRSSKKKNVPENAFVYENTKQTFSNEVKRFRYTTQEVQNLYNEIMNFSESNFQENLFTKGNIFYLNESISKIFIILDYIYNSLWITLKRARETNENLVDISTKNKYIINDSIEKSEYYLELLYKQFGYLNNKFLPRNFKNIDICINTAKNLLVAFSDFVYSSEEFEAFSKFKDLIIQDSEMIKQTLLVFRAMLEVAKKHKKDIHYGVSGLKIESKKLVSKKNKVEIPFNVVDGNSKDCENCKELHAESYFEEKLLTDYKINSIEFKKSIKKIINDVFKLRKNSVNSLDAQKYIFDKLMEVISIENGIVKNLSFVSDAIGSQVSAMMLKNIFNKSNYLLDNIQTNSKDNLKRYAEILSNNLLILKFSAIRLLVLKNLQYHLMLLEKLEKELKILSPNLSTYDSLLKFNLEKIHDLSILIKEIKFDSEWKNDRRINYLFCQFVKEGLLPDVNDVNKSNDKVQSIIQKLFPNLSIEKMAKSNVESIPTTTEDINSSNITSIDGESVEITYFDNKNPTKDPVTYHELIKHLRVDIVDDIKIVNIKDFNDALLNKIENNFDQLFDDVGSSAGNISFKDELEKSKVKDDFICGMMDLYEVKDIWTASEFNMTMPKYTPLSTTTIPKKPFGFAKKVDK